MNDNSGNDFFAIQTLYSKYCYSLDQNNPELLIDCFAENGVFQVAERLFQGAEQFRAIALYVGDRPRHHYANLWVKSIAGDLAQAAAYFFLIDLATGACAGYGNYDDELVRDSNRVWRFRHRRVTFLWQSEAYKARTAAIPKK